MASNVRKSASGKSSGGRKTQSAPKSRGGKEQRGAFYQNRFEILFICISVICLLIILSDFGLAGPAGKVMAAVLFGLFGWSAHILPFLIFFATVFFLANRKNSAARHRILGVILLFLVIGSVLQLAHYGDSSAISFGELYENAAEMKNGGGVIGGGFAKILCSVTGLAGAYIILVALILILMLFITDRVIVNAVNKRMNRAGNHLKQMEADRREDARRKAEIREEVRQAAEANRKADEAARKEEKYEKFRRNYERSYDIRVPRESTANHSSTAAAANSPAAAKKENRVPVTTPKENVAVPEVPEKNKTAAMQMVHAAEKPFIDVDMKPIGQKKRSQNTFQIHRPETVPEEVVEEKPVQVAETARPAAETVRPAADMVELSAAPAQTEAVQEEDPRKVLSDLEREKQRILEKNTIQGNRPKNSFLGDIAEEKDLTGGASSTHGVPVREKKPGMLEVPKELGGSGPAGSVPVAAAKTQTPAAAEKTGGAVNPVMEVPKPKKPRRPYVFPPTNLLTEPKRTNGGSSDEELRETAEKLEDTLSSFGVNVKITDVSCGPTVTRYELQPEHGVKVSRITALADDIKLNLAAADIRIEAPIPGKAAIGIEVPNKENSTVFFRELIESPAFKKSTSKVSFAVGKDIGGDIIVTDIAKMPHVLIAGQTGSGKSVCINTLILSILFKAKPDEVKFIMIDPKMVELAPYNGIPHLMLPVVTDPKKAAGALQWAVAEMTRRYQEFANEGVREIKGYNQKIGSEDPRWMPQIVIIVDELADLMMVSSNEVEDAICRLAQLARAAGIHLVVATQRPSVNVVTGLIKANIPSRIAFSVASQVDSRTILDGAGAEKLLGRGDMLFFPSGYPKPVRVQGAFATDDEVTAVVDFIKENNDIEADEELAAKILEVGNPAAAAALADAGESAPEDDRDEYFEQAGRFIIEKDKASIGMLQRVYRIGFNRAARIMDQLADAGVVSEEDGTKPRRILMKMEEFDAYLNGELTGEDGSVSEEAG